MAIITQFTVFPKLSYDLRAMIWDLVSQQPCRIQFGHYIVRKTKLSKGKDNELVSERDLFFSGKHPDYPRPWRLKAEARVPSVLMTCQESRYWAMKHYHLEFKDQLYTKALWFNPKVDILVFNTHTALLVFVRGGCTFGGLDSRFTDSSKMPVVERVVLLESLRTYMYSVATETTKRLPHLKSLVARTDGVRSDAVLCYSENFLSGGAVLPSLRVRMNHLWHSDEWRAIRAYSQMPELQILTVDEMLDAGLAEPFGPSNKPPKRRRRNLKVDQNQMPPVRQSDRIKSMETKNYFEDCED
ncbi:uncharacterized protein EAF01_005855 [Botrytis porri]|uniref:2EXR domain-containing protein n=1 Tax=Botrytis porri TaxID=87229 RepID=A0A4Z1L4Y0_9HELO|nr:uncharacterized protein EAF01_005855 [Botrytis porri]KAF7905334.1 hypothetical protein EAF01_005855 [Botrytis porri]TGO91839.1 hypothetical protein BPOR_0017g00210 [Botrytis porri]